MVPLIIYKGCDECSHTFEIEWDGATSPTADGTLPSGDDMTGWWWKEDHFGSNRECESIFFVLRSEFDNLVP